MGVYFLLKVRLEIWYFVIGRARPMYGLHQNPGKGPNPPFNWGITLSLSNYRNYYLRFFLISD